MHVLVEGTLKGQKRSAAKIITIIENDELLKKEIFTDLFPHTGNLPNRSDRLSGSG